MTTANIFSEPLEWLVDFEKTNKRKLRVLHIGNIANNAYNNAKIQRQYGIEADVLCYDSYHIMECPEWEDAPFRGEVDHSLPDWFSTSLRGWSRPRWFVQGPAEFCMNYLRARWLGRHWIAGLLWRNLEADYWKRIESARLARKEQPNRAPLRLSISRWLVEIFDIARAPSRSEYLKFGDVDQAESSSPAALRVEPIPVSRFSPEAANLDRLSPFQTGQNEDAGFFQALAKTVKRVPLLKKIVQKIRKIRDVAVNLRNGLQLFLVRCFTKLRRQISKILKYVFSSIWIYIGKLTFQTPMNHFSATANWEARLALSRKRRAEFLDIADKISSEVKLQVSLYVDHHSLRFFDVMTRYDIIQGYSIDGFIPYMNGITRFASYEHGTIRDLPWEPTLVGVVCKKVYEESPQVFVTNSDVLPSVERLKLNPEKVVYLPHAFDDAKLRRFRRENPRLVPPSGPPVFFSPTRHHWQDKSGSWTKGNDVFLRAAGVLAAEGHAFSIILVEWGKEVADSRALIAELGLADRVTWVPTMKKRELWAAYCRAHVVVDQFTLPALGGVGFETMALGRRLLTALDMDQLRIFFGAAPPCLPARSVEECAARMREVVADPDDTKKIGLASSSWMETFHSAKRIVSLQAAAYKRLIETTDLAEWEKP